MRNNLTQKRLKELVHYNPETGVFTCLKKNTRRNIGDVLGTANHEGYLTLEINSCCYQL